MLVAVSGLKHLNKVFQGTRCFKPICQGKGHMGSLKCRYVLTRNRIGNRFSEISLSAGGIGTEYMCLPQGVWSPPDLEG